MELAYKEGIIFLGLQMFNYLGQKKSNAALVGLAKCNEDFCGIFRIKTQKQNQRIAFCF